MPVDVERPGLSTTVASLRLRTWRLGPGQPTLVTDLFSDEDFHVIVDDRGDVHIASRDGRFYLGWFSDGRLGTDNEGWTLAVTGTAEIPGYHATFDAGTPAEVVAATVTAVLNGSRPLRSP